MSAIDITKPVAGLATTQSVRDNFAAAASELDANAAQIAANVAQIATNLATNNAQDGRLDGIDAEQITQNGRLDANETSIGNNAAAAAAAQAKADSSVQLAGAQTIEDQKTFTTNPQSNAAQAGAAQALTRKDYVDQAIADAIAAIPPPVPTFPISAYLIGFNPNGVFPGTWTQVPEGTFLMATVGGADPSGGSNDAVTISHSHTATQAAHSHSLDSVLSFGTGSNAFPGGNNAKAVSSTGNATPAITVNPAGVAGTGLNRPKYVGVEVWQRTA